MANYKRAVLTGLMVFECASLARQVRWSYDMSMEARIAKLEEFAAETCERLVRIETRLDQTATKADVAELRTEMHRGFADMIKWVVGTAIVLGASAITVMTFVLNHATPRNPPPQPAPIVIQLPAQLAPAPAPVTRP